MIEHPAGRREWLALAVLCLPVLIASMDVSVLFFAVPFIARDLEPSATQQLWMFDIYGFVLAGLLMTMGSLGDRVGRRRLLLIGAVAFSAASLLAAYAESATMLIVARAVLGIAGATLMPSTLALIRNVFHVDSERTKAVAIWTAVLTGGISLGPIISGVLLEHFWWGSVFLINIPAMLVFLVAAPLLLPESKGARSDRFDWQSSLLALGAILPLIQAIKSAATDGWSLQAVAFAATGLLMGWAFAARQLSATVPMVDVRMLAERRFGGSILINILAMFAIMGNSIILTQYLQSVLGFSPLRAALWSLAPSVAVGAAAPLAAKLATTYGRPRVMAGGFGTATAGFLLLSTVVVDSPLALCLVSAGLIVAGLVAVLSLITDYVVGAAPAERAGSVAGLVQTSTELGGALGIALLGSVLAAVYRSRVAELMPLGVPTTAASQARETLAGATVGAESLPAGQGDVLLLASRTAYVAAMHGASFLAAGVLVVTAVLTLVLLRDTGGKDEDESRTSDLADALNDDLR